MNLTLFSFFTLLLVVELDAAMIVGSTIVRGGGSRRRL